MCGVWGWVGCVCVWGVYVLRVGVCMCVECGCVWVGGCVWGAYVCGGGGDVYVWGAFGGVCVGVGVWGGVYVAGGVWTLLLPR